VKSSARLIGRFVALAILLVPAMTFAAAPGSYGVAIVSTSTGGGTQNVRITYGDSAPAPMSATRRLQAIPTRSVTSPGPLAPMHAKIGDVRRFWTRLDGRGPAQTTFSSVNATLRYSSEHGDLWIDNDVPSEFIASVHESLTRDIENAYLTVHDNFGQISYAAPDVERHPQVRACDPAGRAHGSVPAFVPSHGDLLNVLLVAPGRVRADYSDETSYHYQAEIDCGQGARSNELAGLVVVPMPPPGREREAADGTYVYMSTQLAVFAANYVRHEIRAPRSQHQQFFVGEGLASLAQDFAVNRLFARHFDTYSTGLAAQTYLANPNAYNIIGFGLRDAKGPPADSRGTFGSAYLLQRYLYDTLGESYLRRVVDSDAVGSNALESATGLPIDEIFRRFARNLLQPHAEGMGLPLCAPATDIFGSRRDLNGVHLEPLTNDAVDVAEGGVSFFVSSRPIASVTSSKGSVSFVQVPYVSPMPPAATTSCALE
jgi:hypothetical protein